MKRDAPAPRRVLHLRTVVGRGGGPEKTLLNSHRFSRSDYELRLAYFHPRGDRQFDLPDRAAAVGANLTPIPESGPCDPRALRRLASLIRSFRPDVLHAHDYKTNVLSALFGKWFGVPAVTTLHGYVSVSPRLNAYYRIDRWALRRMERVFVVSSDLIEYARQTPVAPERIVLIENGIDLDEFRRRRTVTEAKLALGLDPHTFTVAAVGRLTEEKGFDVLIRAAKLLRDGGWRGRILIAGEGPDRAALESLIGELACGDVVRLMGYRSDVADLLQASDAFVLSSRREAFPNAVLEAMALQAPIVATRVAGVPDMLVDGESGLLVDAEDASGIAAALRRLSDDRTLGERLARAARQTCEVRFCFRRRMEKEQAVYDDLLGSTVAAT
jgi:glycosyltransferase involved in cell wall biosynthesis